ncbi:hypothetical protein KIH74_03320 [Kineosporia sp. J2-2]|uniref:Four helix bundle sensory module for signal transduction n=1 Tax=Kineosporia corallincola TaxID=2835133 RepID=A0ABS5TA45_9ACTN|nr:hypothetical protein [Kineosporia corallincola]MBT0767937.1 hypothetical protein [Kineosporia corallincola]
MTQTIIPPPPADAVAVPPRRGSSATAALRESFSGSPGRLRLIAIGAVVSVLVSALLGGWALQMRSSALDRATSSSEHLLLVQGIQTDLVQADADATNAFLSYGLEPQAQREGYIKALKSASADLATAARHSSADADALGQANAALTRYSGYVASARANNRQGLPVGASYLEAASDLMGTSGTEPQEGSVIALLKQRTDADTAAVADAFGTAGNARWLLVLAAVIGVGGLLAVQVLVARHSHRYLNLPTLASTVVLVVMLAGAAAVMLTAQTEAADVRSGPLAEASAISDSRVLAFDAKSKESLTLINRGSATAADAQWKASFNEAADLIDTRENSAAAEALDDYREVHEKINDLDLDGSWDEAVELATADGGDSANGLFDQYDNASSTSLAPQTDSAVKRLGEAGNLLLPTGLALLVVGLLCAAGAWRGISLRLDEYR